MAAGSNNNKILNCNLREPFKWKVSILTETRSWTFRKPVYTIKTPFMVKYSIFGAASSVVS